jgi:hypothetical protein
MLIDLDTLTNALSDDYERSGERWRAADIVRRLRRLAGLAVRDDECATFDGEPEAGPLVVVSGLPDGVTRNLRGC